MIVLWISTAAFVAAGITLFSGFGLGTVLMPVIALFLPVSIAVAITAIVHLLVNLFKLLLLRRCVDLRVLLKFGVPALIAAIPGALLLDHLANWSMFSLSYSLMGITLMPTPVKFVIGLLLITFAYAETTSLLDRYLRGQQGLVRGGIISGFFGGLSGHQGALRSAFLTRAKLTPDAFVATSAAISTLVDCSRLIIYGLTFDLRLLETHAALISSATLAAFCGVFLGTRYLTKITIRLIQGLVAALLYLIGGLLCVGLL